MTVDRESDARPVPIECPNCSIVNDMHAEPGLAAPTQGDMGICWSCREPYIFELVGRRFTPEEFEVYRDDYARVVHAMVESRTPSEATELRREAGE